MVVVGGGGVDLVGAVVDAIVVADVVRIILDRARVASPAPGVVEAIGTLRKRCLTD